MVLFCVGQLFFTYKGVETLPFFNYGMFSEPKQQLKEYTLFVAKVDGKKINLKNLNNHNYQFIISNLKNYTALGKNDFNDPIIVDINRRFKGGVSDEMLKKITLKLSNSKASKLKFQLWLAKVIKEEQGQPIKRLEIDVENYVYTNEGFSFLSKKLLFEHEY